MATALAVVAAAVFKGGIVGFKSFAVDLDGRGEKRPSRALCILRGGDYNLAGVGSAADQSDAWPVLGDEHALVINAGRDLHIEPPARTGLRCVIHRSLDGWIFRIIGRDSTL